MSSITLLNERDVARITGISLPTLRRWRVLGKGPRFIKLGALVRYKEADLSWWIESSPNGGSQQEAA